MARKIDLKSERIFENRKVAGENIRAKQSKYYWATAPVINEFNSKTFLAIRNKSALEIGCSDGTMAAEYSRFCDSFTGVDISDVGIEKARSRKLLNAEFQICDAHKLPFDNATFDVVIVNSLLHHLDLNVVLKEIARVLKEDGILCAREPLGINPIFSTYRTLTPKARTVDEQPFTFSDFKLISTLFRVKEVKFFGLLSIFSAFFSFELIRKILTSVDAVIGTTPLKYFFWQFYGFYSKK